jgi:hypothetical protein
MVEIEDFKLKQQYTTDDLSDGIFYIFEMKFIIAKMSLDILDELNESYMDKNPIKILKNLISKIDNIYIVLDYIIRYDNRRPFVDHSTDLFKTLIILFKDYTVEIITLINTIIDKIKCDCDLLKNNVCNNVLLSNKESVIEVYNIDLSLYLLNYKMDLIKYHLNNKIAMLIKVN